MIIAGSGALAHTAGEPHNDNIITTGFKHILTANESTANSNIKDSHLPSSFFMKVD
jgi:hypothetical protein